MRFWLVAFVIVAVLGSLEAGAQPAPSLQTRVDAFAQQLRLRGVSDAALGERGKELATRVLDAWNQSPHTTENRALLESWLQNALDAVMPGGRGVLPSAPTFSASAVPNLSAVPAAPALAVAVEPLPAPRPATGPAPMPEPSPPPAVESVVGPPPEPSAATRRTAAKPVAPPTTPPEPSIRPTDPAARSKWSRHPSAAPLEWRDPFRQDPVASPNPLRSGARHETRRPVFGASTVKVNLNHLRAEVRGYNAALSELQSLVMKPDCGIADLVRIAEELERLTATKSFLSLYRTGLTAGEQRALPDSPSPEIIRELAYRRANRLLSDPSVPHSAAEQAALRGLTARLASHLSHPGR